MFKYVKYEKKKIGAVTKQFSAKVDNVKINYFDVDVVSISSDSEASINALIDLQDTDINCVEITKEEFKTLVSGSLQVKRINEVLAKKLKKALEQIENKYCIQERETWAKQESEAKAFKTSGDEADAPFLKILSDRAGVELDTFADLVIANSLRFSTLSATALSDKQALQDTMFAEIGL